MHQEIQKEELASMHVNNARFKILKTSPLQMFHAEEKCAQIYV